MTLEEQKKQYIEKKHTGLTFITGTQQEGPNWRGVVIIQNWLDGALLAESQKNGDTAWGNEQGAFAEAEGLARTLHRQATQTAKAAGIDSRTVEKDFT